MRRLRQLAAPLLVFALQDCVSTSECDLNDGTGTCGREKSQTVGGAEISLFRPSEQQHDQRTILAQFHPNLN
jgi:hypothetical protein